MISSSEGKLYTAQNGLELKLLQVLLTILYRIKNFLPEEEMDIRIDYVPEKLPADPSLSWSQEFLTPVVS